MPCARKIVDHCERYSQSVPYASSVSRLFTQRRAVPLLDSENVQFKAISGQSKLLSRDDGTKLFHLGATAEPILV
jgi:hypothetical protein